MSTAHTAPWPVDDTAIGAWMGLRNHAPGPGHCDTSAGDTPPGATLLLSHASFRALFDAVAPDTYVSLTVVACYLGVAKLTIERRLSSVFDQGGRRWRTVLMRRMAPGAGGPALVEAFYRWGFVTGELEPVMQGEMARRRLREIESTPDLRRPRKTVPCIHDRAGPLRYLQDAGGSIVGALGQSHITAHLFIEVFNGGGRLVTLEMLEALAMPWTGLAARLPWDDGVRELLAQYGQRVVNSLETGVAATRARLVRPR